MKLHPTAWHTCFRMLVLFFLFFSGTASNWGAAKLACCQAQTSAYQTQTSAPPRDKASFTRVVLASGVRLLIKPEAASGQVAISLFIRMEPDIRPQEAAVGEMVARALFYGNVNRTQNGILTLAGQAGGNVDVLHTPEYVAITASMQPAQFPEATHLLSDCLKNAEFVSESLQRALNTIQSERAARRKNGFTLGSDTLSDLLSLPAPTEDALRRVTPDQAQTYFRRHYLPARTVIAVVGAVDTSNVVRLFEAFLADYKRSARLHFSEQVEPAPRSAQTPSPASDAVSLRSVLTLKAPSDVAFAFVATPAPTVRSPDYPAFVVLTALVGGGHASRLFQQVRESVGIGYSIGAQFQVDLASPLVTYLQWNPHRNPASGVADTAPTQPVQPAPQEIVGILQTLLDNVVAHPPSEAEITRARNFAIGQDALRHERAHERSFIAGWYETLGLGYAYDQDFPRYLAAVTRNDVLRVAKLYFGTRQALLVTPH